jgi:hypothetical protein
VDIGITIESVKNQNSWKDLLIHVGVFKGLLSQEKKNKEIYTFSRSTKTTKLYTNYTAFLLHPLCRFYRR